MFFPNRKTKKDILLRDGRVASCFGKKPEYFIEYIFRILS
jgi:hypothetical protein